MIATTRFALNRSAAIAHPNNARFGLREPNDRGVTSSELSVKL